MSGVSVYDSRYQPITQQVAALPEIRSVADKTVVIVGEDYYIAINGKWEKIISKKRYLSLSSSGSSASGVITPNFSAERNSGDFSVNGAIIKPKLSGRFIIHAQLAYNVVATTGSPSTARIQYYQNGSLVGGHIISGIDDAKFYVNLFAEDIIDLQLKNEFVVNLEVMTSHSIDYELKINIWEY